MKGLQKLISTKGKSSVLKDNYLQTKSILELNHLGCIDFQESIPSSPIKFWNTIVYICLIVLITFRNKRDMFMLLIDDVDDITHPVFLLHKIHYVSFFGIIINPLPFSNDSMPAKE
ncbi:hypothetical protein SAMN05444380_103137 [Thermophagus xiamenensis]|uniref:Uncharacterized protein n=1 Tax=Thermophagus xiamenensis TaxID=385682 RepID=A0A1I1VZ25_9BACT|nr:hypothetical protein SAMN05444380_103137 [Thermophagus xiamenensis]